MKTTMKTIGLTAVATLALVGCGGSGGSSTSSSTKSNVSFEVNYPITAPNIRDAQIGFIREDLRHPIGYDTDNTAWQINDLRKQGFCGMPPTDVELKWDDRLYNAAYDRALDILEHRPPYDINGMSIGALIGTGGDSDWTATVQSLGRGSTPQERAANNGYEGVVFEQDLLANDTTDPRGRSGHGALDSASGMVAYHEDTETCHQMMSAQWTKFAFAIAPSAPTNIQEDLSTEFQWVMMLGK